MNAPETKKKLSDIQAAVKAGKLDNAALIAELKELREKVKDIDPDPLVVKVLRLTYEYMEANGEFNIQFLEEGDNSMTDFEYLLGLIEHASNEYNREELRELATVLKENAG